MMAYAIPSDERLHSVDILQKMLTNGNLAYNSINKDYLPIQNLVKIFSNKSSVVTVPVISPR